MPITMPIQIAVIQDPACSEPPPEYNIRLVEQPPGSEFRFKLFVMEGFAWVVPGENRSMSEIRLPPETSARISELVDELPEQSMSCNRMSFDGCDYSLMVIRPKGKLNFHWANEDWRQGPDNLHEAWQRVSALANTVYTLVYDRRSNTA